MTTSHRRIVSPKRTTNTRQAAFRAAVSPHLWLDDERVHGSSLFDRLGGGLTLLRLDPSLSVAAFEEAASKQSVPLMVLDLSLPEARKLYGRALVLVRPDQYIAWRGDRVPEDPAAVLAQVTGH